jgi:hypothetical protein
VKTYHLPLDQTRKMIGGWWIRIDPPRVCVSCPECGRVYDLNHKVSASGSVYPGVKCPYAPCEFNAGMCLIDWPGWVIPESANGRK